MSELISIIMPVKNTALFLAECVESIIHQTYTNWELLAVNDSSTDDSLNILERYASHDKRIIVLQNEGQGIISALNTGYKICAGDYISRMDSDDINSLHKLEYMLGELQSAGKNHIALGQVKYFATNEVGDGYKKYELWLNSHIGQGNSFEEIYKECVIPSPCWMLHRDDFELIGGFANSFYPEDYDLCFRMYKAGLHTIPTSQMHLFWRDSPQRTSRTDSNYNKEKMLAIKCYYFLDIDYSDGKNLVLWGAGKRGKFIANYFVEKGIPFIWVCNNKKKIGLNIYGVKLKSENELVDIPNKQIVVSVSNDSEQAFIKEHCESNLWQAYFFC